MLHAKLEELKVLESRETDMVEALKLEASRITYNRNFQGFKKKLDNDYIVDVDASCEPLPSFSILRINDTWLNAGKEIIENFSEMLENSLNRDNAINSCVETIDCTTTTNNIDNKIIVKANHYDTTKHFLKGDGDINRQNTHHSSKKKCSKSRVNSKILGLGDKLAQNFKKLKRFSASDIKNFGENKFDKVSFDTNDGGENLKIEGENSLSEINYLEIINAGLCPNDNLSTTTKNSNFSDLIIKGANKSGNVFLSPFKVARNCRSFSSLISPSNNNAVNLFDKNTATTHENFENTGNVTISVMPLFFGGEDKDSSTDHSFEYENSLSQEIFGHFSCSDFDQTNADYEVEDVECQEIKLIVPSTNVISRTFEKDCNIDTKDFDVDFGKKYSELSEQVNADVDFLDRHDLCIGDIGDNEQKNANLKDGMKSRAKSRLSACVSSENIFALNFFNPTGCSSYSNLDLDGCSKGQFLSPKLEGHFSKDITTALFKQDKMRFGSTPIIPPIDSSKNKHRSDYPDKINRQLAIKGSCNSLSFDILNLSRSPKHCTDKHYIDKVENCLTTRNRTWDNTQTLSPCKSSKVKSTRL
ncbi:unnamed protein product [Gordionus sp. m RMFG-2023]